jgi:hypothetical protein
MNWTEETIKAFYIDRDLTSDIDIMTELDGCQVLKNSDIDAEKALVYIGHLSINEVKFDIPMPVFKNSELKFIC